MSKKFLDLETGLPRLWQQVLGKFESHNTDDNAHQNLALKNPNPISVNGKSYDGSAAVDVGTIEVAYGGTGGTTQEEAFNNIVAPGGTITGDFNIKNGTIPIINLYSQNASNVLGQIISTYATQMQGSYFKFSQGNGGNTYQEHYSLPVTTRAITASANYNILTDKYTVTVKQGGTGATTVAGAQQNLGIVDLIYPVGSIYMSVNETDPTTLFGGTWEQIKDTFLLSSGENYINGATGGEAKHLLTSEEVPAHSHRAYGYTGDTDDWSFMTIKRTNRAKTQVATSTSSGKYAFTNTSTSNLDNPYPTRTDIDNRTTENEPFNNMPPYLVVNVWKRTA